jgi:plastocyanin
MRRVLVPAAALLCLGIAGCKPDAAIRQGAVVDRGSEIKYDPAPNAASTGTVTGVVQFAGTPPQRVPIDMSQDPACSLAGQPNLSEQVIVDHGKLANVFVYVKGAPHLKAPVEPVVIDQHGCRFQPHVVAVAAGGSVEFRNSDPAMHNVHSMAVQAGNRNIDLSQGPGAKPERLFYRDPENMIPVRCNNHPWMNAFINVAPSTFFAVTGPDGSFTIGGLPEGSYDVVLVHEKLGERHVQVNIKPQTNTAVTVTYKAQ